MSERFISARNVLHGNHMTRYWVQRRTDSGDRCVCLRVPCDLNRPGLAEGSKNLKDGATSRRGT